MRKKWLKMTETFLLSAMFAAGFLMSASAGENTESVSEDEILESELLSEETFETELSQENEGDVTNSRIRFASDMKEVHEALKQARSRNWMYDDLVEYEMEDTAASAETTSGVAPAAAEAKAQEESLDLGDGDYSTTNVREQGVDESDIIKTDGRYIYILSDNSLLIVSAQGEESREISRTDLPSDEKDVEQYARELYIDGDTLCVVCETYTEPDYTDTLGYYVWYARRYTTILYTYDISDREHPLCLGSISQEGQFLQSRKTDDIVYLYSFLMPYLEEAYENSSLGVVIQGEQVQPEDFCIPACVTSESYLVVSSMSIEKPDAVIDQKVLVSGAGTCYVTKDSLYVVNEDYGDYRNYSEIIKFHCEKGQMEGVAAARVLGSVHDSFCLDEYQENLRVLTTYTGSDAGEVLEAVGKLFGMYYMAGDRWERHNAVYILDQNMEKVSCLKGIAKNEEIRSARFFGDTAYFVTYENTDPLFTADLSDPTNPVLTGELEITGFSAYLHPYGDGRLLGIGYESDPDTGVVTGLKLSMFDISDPVHVQEMDRLVIDGITYCPAIGKYKSILANGQKNLIGFFCENRYMVFSWLPEQGFVRRLHYDLMQDGLMGKADEDSCRGLYSGDDFYLAGGSFVINFEMEDDDFDKELVLLLSSADN